MPPVLDPEEQRKRQLLALINARRGIYAPAASPQPVAPAVTQAQQNGEPTGFFGALSKGLKFATSGEAAANALLPGNPGTDVRNAIESIPYVGKPLAWAADVATSPLTIATAGFGGALGAGVRAGSQAAGVGGFGRLVAPLVEPMVQGPLAYRVGAAVAGSAGSEIGSNLAEAAGLPAPLQLAAGLAGGAVGIRTVGNAAKAATRNAGGFTAEEVQQAIESGDPVRKFTAILSTAKRQRGELDAARSAEFGARTASIAERLKGVTDPEARAAIIRSGQKGALPSQAFDLPEGTMPRTIQSVESVDTPLIDTLPAGRTLPVGERANPDFIAEKKWYHGTGSKLAPDSLTPGSTSENGLLGQGIYLTDDPRIAAGYAKNRSTTRNGTPRPGMEQSVYAMQVAPQKVLDLNDAAGDDVRRVMSDFLDQSLTPNGYGDSLRKALENPKSTGYELYQAMRKDVSEWSYGEQIPSGEFIDIIGEGVTSPLQQLGYDAYTHTGGVQGGKAHQVLVLFDPNDAYAAAGRRVPINDWSRLNPQDTVTTSRQVESIVQGSVSTDDIAALKQRVTDHYSAMGRVYDEANATEALNKVFTGQIPTPSELGLLQNALGAQFAETVQRLGEQPSLYKKALDLVGVPRAVMASVDLSIPFRQGALGVSRKSFWDSWRPMVKAFGDEKYANAVREQLATDAHPVMDALRTNGLITGLPTKGLAGKEEAFMSGIAELLPGVKQSERGAVTFLNKFRADYAKDIYDGWVKKGVDVTDKDVADLVKWTGLVSGRGDLSFASAGRDVPVLLNALFFSPKFISARLQALNPKTYLDMNPLMRKEAARDMISYFAPGAAALTALGVAGKAGVLPGVKVETDPRSSDFGKVQIGQTRLDPWGGFQPIARYAAQLVSGQAKSGDGRIREIDRAVTLGNFARSKLAPVPSFLVDAMQGTTFTGQEVDVTSGNGLSAAAAQRLVPLLMQDMAEAIKTDGGWGAIKTAPAIVGFGTQTYNSRSAIQNAGAQEIYGKPWSSLTGEEQLKVRTAYAEQLAKQEPPSAATVSGFVNNENLSTQAFEQQLNEALRSGQINNRQFTQALQDRLSMRLNRVQGVVDFNGNDKGTDPTVLDGYFALRDQATVNGIVDYQMLDQLQHNYLKELKPDDQRMILERAGFQHAPDVQWWADAKKTIQDSGYYDQQAAAMEKLAPLLKAIGAEGLTYNQLAARAGGSDDPAEKIRIAAVMKRIDAMAGDLQKITRLKNPELDKALAAVYGSTPLAMRR